MIKKLITILTALLPTIAIAQNTITVNSEYTKTIDFDFNNEWQYLSTELYLYNAHLFSSMLNGIYNTPKKKKKPDNIQNIFITAKINGTNIEQIAYPIYNFRVDNSDGQMHTFTAQNYEAINIIDNLPLTTITNGKIDVTIKVDIITNENTNQIYNFVAEQLTNISNFATPISATKTLVGELGSLIKTKNNGNEYRFSSTVRLYEEQNFNKRICSVTVYTIMPISETNSETNVEPLNQYLSTTKSPELNRQTIQQNISQTKYPFIVAVNYKSKYASDPVNGDEITSESIKERTLKAKNNFENKLISNDIYTQETKLSEYLTQFVELKNSINNYTLNAKNKTTDDFSKMYQDILEKYTTLRQTADLRNIQFDKNPIYNNEFKNIYQQIMRTAEIYLETDNNTKNIKNIARISITYNTQNSNKTDSTNNEKILQTLHSINFGNQTSPQIQQINNLITKIEQQQYNQVYAKKIEKIKTLQPSPTATQYCESIKDQINNTYCQLCKIQVDTAIAQYSKKVEQQNRQQATAALNDEIAKARIVIYTVLQKETTIENYFKEKYPETMPDEAKFLYEDFDKLKQQRQNLQNLIKITPQDEKTSTIENTTNQITISTAELKLQLDQLCSKIPEICQ